MVQCKITTKNSLYSQLFVVAFRPTRATRHDEKVPQANGNPGENHSDDDVDPQIAGYTCLAAVVEPIKKGHGENGLATVSFAGTTVQSWQDDRSLTAKNVPGRKTMVTREMDRMTRESWFVASAISTAVSLCDCICQSCIMRSKKKELTHCVAMAIPSTRIVQSRIFSSYSSRIAASLC